MSTWWRTPYHLFKIILFHIRDFFWSCLTLVFVFSVKQCKVQVTSHMASLIINHYPQIDPMPNHHYDSEGSETNQTLVQILIFGCQFCTWETDQSPNGKIVCLFKRRKIWYGETVSARQVNGSWQTGLFLYSCSKPSLGDHSCTTGIRSPNLRYDSWSLRQLGYYTQRQLLL